MAQIATRALRTIATLLIVQFLAACMSGPVVRDQRLTSANAQRITRVLFLYQETRLSAQRTSGQGNVPLSPYDTDLHEFGDALVSKAAAAFQKFGATVIRAAVVPSGEWKQFAPKVIGELPPGTLSGTTLITMFPIGGSAHANNNAATINVTFEVRVIDGASGRLVWNAAIDSRTWQGRNFLNKNASTTRFDQAYADQFLNTLLDTLRTNGLI